jgi:LAO/AO transport system kinase
LYAEAGRAHVVGVTGPPGVGKSTLVAALVKEVRASGRTVAVVAIDPSSPITGGAILGDRVRMQQHAGDAGVFIRSMAARGHIGGLAGTTAAAVSVLAACGFDLVIIETVGTGQSEVEVAALADTTVVLQAPETGDEIQAMKAGLLEVADVVVVGKSDRPGADRAASQLRAMLAIGRPAEAAPEGPRPRPKRPLLLLASGASGQGVPELLEALDRRRDDAPGDHDAARMSRAKAMVEAIVAQRIQAGLASDALRERGEGMVRAVAAHELDPYVAADELLVAFRTDPARR